MPVHHFQVASELHMSNGDIEEIYWSELMSRESLYAFLDNGHLVIHHLSDPLLDLS